MKIVVPVKQVAALDEEFELLEDGSGVDPDFLEWDLNEWDTFSLEAALQIRDGAGGEDHEVVVVTVGDEEADEGLLSCLAKGADRALRIWDDSLQEADVLAVARVLSAAVEREAPDLVLCGVQSSDAVNGATGVALAGYLDLPHVAVVNEPRYATLRAIKQAREKPLHVSGLAELGLDADAVDQAAGSRTLALKPPDRGEGAEMLNGSPAAVAARIVEIVKERMSG